MGPCPRATPKPMDDTLIPFGRSRPRRARARRPAPPRRSTSRGRRPRAPRDVSATPARAGPASGPGPGGHALPPRGGSLYGFRPLGARRSGLPLARRHGTPENPVDVSPRRLVAFLLSLLILVGDLGPVAAIESSRVPLDASAIDLTHAVESYSSQGDRLLVSTAPGADGIVRRIEVRAKDPGTRPNWIVFALTNDSDEQIERLIVARISAWSAPA